MSYTEIIDMMVVVAVAGVVVLAGLAIYFKRGAVKRDTPPLYEKLPRLRLVPPVFPDEWYTYSGNNFGYRCKEGYQALWDKYDDRCKEYTAIAQYFYPTPVSPYPTAFKQEQLLAAGLTKIVKVKPPLKEDNLSS